MDREFRRQIIEAAQQGRSTGLLGAAGQFDEVSQFAIRLSSSPLLVRVEKDGHDVVVTFSGGAL